ncbi:MAG: hypothetical protein C0399_05715 [Syntrophus sp. (in: bacteria)]|nr:hypothetical protein [Syntrophus sp. (in: bacteria)]
MKPSKKHTKKPDKINKKSPDINGDEKKKYKIYLKSAEDVRRLLSTLVNEVRRNDVDIQKARTIGYLAGILLDVFTMGSLEDRLKQLEEAAQKRRITK